MKILNVAEKPSIARQLNQALSQLYRTQSINQQSFSKYNPVFSLQGEFQNQDAQIIVTSVTGHMKEFYYVNDYNWRAIEPQKLLKEEEILQRVTQDKQQIAKNLQKYAEQARVLFLWLDCDREGEAIAYEVIDICKTKFSSTSPRELQNAYLNPVRPDERQNEAVLARQELDLRSGAAFTRFLTISIGDNFDLQKNKLSYGTCQIPTLSFIVQRYLEIKNFKSQPFYYIHLMIKKDQIEAEFSWHRQKLFEKYICATIYQKIMKNPIAKITKVQKKQTKKFKPYPLATVEFQKLASIYLNLSSKQAMSIAEKLYQKGFISYPRTETNSYPDFMNFQSVLNNLQNNNEYKQYLEGFHFQKPRKGKKDDKAHPPIHPIKNSDGSLQEEELKVYDLIARRFIANCSEDAQIAEVEVTADVDEEQFNIKGVQIIKKNYLEIYEKYEKFKERKIPIFQQGEEFEPTELLFKDGKTQPPKLFSESDLINTMDKNQIGTDATIHEHIDNIIKRKYVRKVKKVFYPTQVGVALIVSLSNLDLNIDNPLLRAETEVQMQNICDGKIDRQTMVQRFLKIMINDYQKLKEKQMDFIKSFLLTFNEHFQLDKQTRNIPNCITIPQFDRQYRNYNNYNQRENSYNIQQRKSNEDSFNIQEQRFEEDSINQQEQRFNENSFYVQQRKSRDYSTNIQQRRQSGDDPDIQQRSFNDNRKNFDKMKITLGLCRCKEGNINSLLSKKNYIFFVCNNKKTCGKTYFYDNFYPIKIKQQKKKCKKCKNQILILEDKYNKKVENCNSEQSDCNDSILNKLFVVNKQ